MVLYNIEMAMHIVLYNRQEAFCRHKAAGDNNRQAAIKAGYAVSSACVAANRLMKLDGIRWRIEQIKAGVNL